MLRQAQRPTEYPSPFVLSSFSRAGGPNEEERERTDSERLLERRRDHRNVRIHVRRMIEGERDVDAKHDMIELRQQPAHANAGVLMKAGEAPLSEVVVDVGLALLGEPDPARVVESDQANIEREERNGPRPKLEIEQRFVAAAERPGRI